MTGTGAAEDFSLTDCGPADRALARLGLGGPLPPRFILRAFAAAIVVWLPLCVLALASPRTGEGVAIPFLHDLSTHVRFLVVVPLLVLFEGSIGRRTRLIARHFAQAGLVAAADRPRYDAMLRGAGRAFRSVFAEIVIGLLAAGFVWSAIRGFLSDDMLFWFEEPVSGGGTRLTAAGWWYALGSFLPPFLFLRWFWRYAVWGWLLFRVSRLPLQLVATDPDRTGGLAFVSFGHAAFAQLGFAASCLVAGTVGTRVLFEGAPLAAFQWPIAAFVALSIVVGLLPLAVFWRPLRLAKERGIADYGSFGSRYVQGFQRRWIESEADEQPLDARDDIGPLADIGGGYERVQGMRLVPITLRNALAFAVASLAPMLPLLLAVMPLRELLALLMRAMI